MQRLMLPGSSSLFLITLTLSTLGFAQSPAPSNETIRESDLRADLFFLASDAMRGRLSGTNQNRIAASFLATRFERLELAPMGPEQSYFHPFRLAKASLGTGNELELLSRRGAVVRGQLGQDFYPLRFSASGGVEAEVVFAGFGIRAPGLGHNDYRTENVNGQIVLVLEHDPGEHESESRFDGLVRSEYARELRKALYAQEAGAVGILFVSDVHNHPEDAVFSEEFERAWPDASRRIPRYTLAEWTKRVRIPALRIAPTVADILLQPAGRSLDELLEAAEAEGGVEPVPLPGFLARLHASVVSEVVRDRNVVAGLEGSDPRLRSEWILLSAHYDHDGADGERIFNGADDDGSGTVALLEIAEAYATAARDGVRPRRSILFAAWNSEERGLLGAWAYAEDPLIPLADTVAVLNMDMIGRSEEVPVGGGRRFRGLDVQSAESNRNAVNLLGYSYSADLSTAVKGANRAFELDLKMRYDNNRSNLLRRSDQWPFLQKAVPSLFFHTGLHPDYHTEFDVPEKIEYGKLERIARLVHQLSWELAQREARPRFDVPERAAAR